METKAKPWYASTGVWGGLGTFIIGAWQLFTTTIGPALNVHLPDLPTGLFAFLESLLGAIALHGRVTATTKIIPKILPPS